jgi:RimJ/RimL family protein N-acetyltransferase
MAGAKVWRASAMRFRLDPRRNQLLDSTARWHTPPVMDQIRADFSIKPVLTGEKVTLRPFIEDDLSALHDALRDPEVLRLTGSVHGDEAAAEPDDPGRIEQLRRWYRGRNAQSDRLDLAVVNKASGQCVGEVVLNEWDPGNRSCNFRTFLGPSGRDRGLGTEAVRMIVGYGFEQLGLHRISLQVYAFNPRARHVYEKVGFLEEGVLREELRYRDQWVDATVMSILAHEWKRHHGRP